MSDEKMLPREKLAETVKAHGLSSVVENAPTTAVEREAARKLAEQAQKWLMPWKDPALTQIIWFVRVMRDVVPRLVKELEEAGHPSVEVEAVLAIKAKHVKTWRNFMERYWWLGLMEEVWELTLALLGWHEHSPEVELRQIAAICLNWLEMRKERQGKA